MIQSTRATEVRAYSDPNQESVNILPIFIQWLMTLFGYKYRKKEKPKGSIINVLFSND